MFSSCVCQRIEVYFRNQQQMHWRGRADVFETKHLIVFVNGLRRNIFGGDFAENTIIHNGSNGRLKTGVTGFAKQSEIVFVPRDGF